MRKYYMGCGGIAQPENLSWFENRDYVAEQKWDGIWAACIIDENGKIEFWSRNNKNKTEFEDIKPLAEMNLGIKDSILIGELMAFSQASKSQDHTTFNIFDIIKIQGKDVSEYNFPVRRYILEELNIYNDFYKLTEQRVDNFKAFYDEVISQGGEGIVIKKWTGKTPYRGLTRNINWYKVKKKVRISYVITGFNISDADSWKGEIKSIRAGLYRNGELIEVCNIGSMTSGERSWFSEHQQEAIGKVIEAEGYEIFKSGAVRHPHLVGFRDDVEPQDCNFEQIKRI